MPSKFPLFKSKGSQASSNSARDSNNDGSTSRQPLYTRQYSPPPDEEEYQSFYAQPHPSPSFENPGGSPRHLGPPSDSYASRPDSPSAEQEQKRGFRQRLGLAKSRENVLDRAAAADDHHSSGLVRRTSRRGNEQSQPQQRSPVLSQDRQAQQQSLASSTVRRNTVAVRGGGKRESTVAGPGVTRDLADFFRTTAPTGDPRRPISIVTSPPAGQAWASESNVPQSASVAEARQRAQLADEDDDERYYTRHRPVQSQGDYQAYHPPQESGGLDVSPDGPGQQPYSQRPSEAAHRRAFPPPYHESGPASELASHLGPDPREEAEPAVQVQRQTAEGLIQQGQPQDMQAGLATLQPPPLRPGSAGTSEPPTPIAQPRMQPVPGQGQMGQYQNAGRSTPPPTRVAADMSEPEVNNLIRDYRELREKYSKVKRYYFEKEDQVKTLQNAMAHQRLSASRTSLDDGEYITRLTRLDGLIKQLSFGFRKDWARMPTWLQPYVNKDAITNGKQEMTAVGRAFISRWLMDEVFDRYFHPSLEPEVSMELKAIQRSIRQNSAVLQTGEEEEALTSKIISWRLATIDGLQQRLSGPEATMLRQELIERLDSQLVAELLAYMNEPSPPGLEQGVHMIIELVVGMLMHLPFESRDVSIEYFVPGTVCMPEVMSIESGIPALVTPMADGDKASINSDTSDQDEREDGDGGSKDGEHRKGIFKKAAGLQKAGSAGASQNSLVQTPGSAGGVKDETSARVRMCIFLGLQIRGKMVLAKAPVYTI